MQDSEMIMMQIILCFIILKVKYLISYSHLRILSLHQFYAILVGENNDEKHSNKG